MPHFTGLNGHCLVVIADFTTADAAQNVVQVANDAAECSANFLIVTVYLDTLGGIYSFMCSLLDYCSKYGMHLTVKVGSTETPVPFRTETQS